MEKVVSNAAMGQTPENRVSGDRAELAQTFVKTQSFFSMAAALQEKAKKKSLRKFRNLKTKKHGR